MCSAALITAFSSLVGDDSDHFVVSSAQVPEELHSAAVPESHQHRQVCCLPPKLPDFAANIPRTDTERGEGAPQQADELAKPGGQLTAGSPRDWCWRQGKGMLGKSFILGKEPAGSKTVQCGSGPAPAPGTNEAKGQGPSCCREGPGAVGGLAILRTSAAHLRAPDIIP